MSTVAFSVWVTFVPKSQAAFGNIRDRKKCQQSLSLSGSCIMVVWRRDFITCFPLSSHGAPGVDLASIRSFPRPSIEGFSATISLALTSQFEDIVRTDTGSPKRQWVKDREGTWNFPGVYLIFVRTHTGQCIHTCKQRHSQLIWYIIQIWDEI